MKCKKETKACGSSTHDDYFHRRTQVLFWPWQSGRSSSYSWWWRQLLPLRLAPASVNLWKPTWSCTNQKQQKRVCLIYAQDRRKTTRAVNSAETSESERGELQRNTSHRTDGSAQVQIPVAQYQTRFKNNNHNTKKCWTLFLKYTNK